MSDPKPPLSKTDPKFLQLVLCYLEDQITAEDFAVLQNLLRTEPARRNVFVRFCLARALVVEVSKGIGEAGFPDLCKLQPETPSDLMPPNDLSDAMILPAVREAPLEEQIAETSPVLPESPQPNRPRSPLAILRFQVRIAAAIALLLMGAIVVRFALHRANAPAVTVSAAADAKWEGSTDPVMVGTRIAAGQMMVLTTGCVELKFAGGALVILEAPVRFNLQSGSSIFVNSGKLTATVHGGGFTVHSPTSTVLDLGTEFGVDVGQDGAAHIEVFQGRVRAEATSGSPTSAVGQVLSVGQAADVSAGAIVLDPRGVNPQRFVRRLTSSTTQLSMTDLLCGGDGTTHRRGMTIDVTSGNASTKTPPTPTPRPTDGTTYHPVPSLLIVDGCFIPDGRHGPQQIDSDGHSFAFPPTTGKTYGPLSAGAPVPWYDRVLRSTISTVLGSIDYSAPGHSALVCHPNKGITIDLDALRRLYPGRSFSRFRAVVGNSFINGTPGTSVRDPRADAYLIVDGVKRMEQLGFTNRDGPIEVDIALNPSDRFFTLATTDGGDDNINFKFVVWGDPTFFLSSRQSFAQ